MSTDNETVKIVIRRKDVPQADKELGITEEDRDLNNATLFIFGEPAKRLTEDADSVTVRGPFDDNDGPLQIVVRTNSGKVVGILDYRWNKDGKKWEFEKPDDEGSEGGLSPVLKAIGDAAKEIVAAIEESEGATAATPAGATPTPPAGKTK